MALEYNRIATFDEVNFETTDWQVSGPDAQGALTYIAVNDSASVTITRSDGKTLDWDPDRGTRIRVLENVVSFHAAVDTLPFV